jgi:hypothetical protein
VRNPPDNSVGSPQHIRRALEFALGERIADGAARHPFAVHRHGSHRFDAEGSRRSAQHREIAGAAASEAEILTDEHPACAQCAHEHIVDELCGRQRGQPGIETRDIHPGDPERREKLEFAAQGRQSRWRGVASEKLAGVRIEGQNHGGQPEILGRFREAVEHRLVSAVNTVEITNGQGDVIRSAIGRCGNSSVDLHAWKLLSLPRR